uniref:FLYWCH-type domain-containing protein n=1 Tax=Panagrolaimus sp. JU765 TaxID=591449 RepID=A0AC34R9E9_9BILA
MSRFVDFVPSNKRAKKDGSDSVMAYLEGYLYSEETRKSAVGHRRWKCIKRDRCKARIQTTQEGEVVGDVPDHDHIATFLFFQNLKITYPGKIHDKNFKPKP